jgi:hypothetical protein
MVAASKSRYNTPTASEDYEKAATSDDEKIKVLA